MNPSFRPVYSSGSRSLRPPLYCAVSYADRTPRGRGRSSTLSDAGYGDAERLLVDIGCDNHLALRLSLIHI